MLVSKLYFRAVALATLVIFVSFFQSLGQTKANPPFAVIYVHENGALELNGRACGSLSKLKELNARLKQFFSETEKITEEQVKTVSPKSSCYTTPVFVRVDESLNYGSLADLIVNVRAMGADPIKIQGSHNQDGLFVTVPQEPCPDQDLSLLEPNALSLVVRIASDGELTINQESIGTTGDTSMLRNRLSVLFQTRAEQGAFRPGTKDVEKTLFIKAARSSSFDDVIKIINVVNQAGADPIGLQIDDLEP